MNKGKIQLITSHLPGYGSPEEWHICVVYDNRLLQESVVYSLYQLGAKESELQRHWNKFRKNLDAFTEFVAKSPLASPLCDVCGHDTLDGGSSCVEMYFCLQCANDGTLDLYRQEYLDACEVRQKQRDTEIADDKERRRLEAVAAMQGFHYKDNWYFKRLEDGSVLVSRVHSVKGQEQLYTQICIDPMGWASIVTSVSGGGETSERFFEFLKYHKGDV
jgi:hypothetical protein